jgi:uncharacterized lipoprotein YddW (UPF0748 family)
MVSRPRPMFYNDDGDSCLLEFRGPFRPTMVTRLVDVLIGTPVTTLVFCVIPSDCTNYPSEVAEMEGWRETPAHRHGTYRRKFQLYRHVREQDWDIPRMVMERARQTGLSFVPSMRMNDAHFAQKISPQEHPLTGRFWLEHQDLTIGPAEFPSWGNPNVLDFRHAAVRDYKLALAGEAIDRYAADGFEMDWTRHYTFFKPGEEQPQLLTEMVRQVRARLDARGRAVGARLPLIMRVAASIAQNQQLGLDVVTWVREGMVDYLVPSSPNRYISADMPIAEWAALVRETPVEIHPSPDSAAPRGDGQATLPMYRAAASNYYAMGAHGFYLFNLFCRGFPLANEDYVLMRDVSHPDALLGREKLFWADVHNWRADTDTLPVPLTDAQHPAHVGIWVGDDLTEARADTTLKRATLRLRVDSLEPDDRLEVALNGHGLDLRKAHVAAPSQRDVIAFNASIPTWTWERSVLGSNPGIWFELDLEGDELLRRGDNRVEVRRVGPTAAPTVPTPRLINVDLKVDYDYCGEDALSG